MMVVLLLMQRITGWFDKYFGQYARTSTKIFFIVKWTNNLWTHMAKNFYIITSHIHRFIEDSIKLVKRSNLDRKVKEDCFSYGIDEKQQKLIARMPFDTKHKGRILNLF